MKHIVILGSTGSIGIQTLELVDKDENLKVGLLVASKNIDLLEKQICEYRPEYAYVEDQDLSLILKNRIKERSTCRILSDLNELIEEIRNKEYDMIVNAIVGMAGILPTFAAVEAGHKVAIANKETLVCAGHILTKLAEQTGARLIPIDSEHSAIAQCLVGEDLFDVDHLILTASGGPFYKKNLDLSKISVEEALAHPNWSMGAKISIDSATMVNKALEVMEAGWLFAKDHEDIRVLIHPESIVHSMVCFRDGAIKAQIGAADMRLPISYALYEYKRRKLAERLDFTKISGLHFYEVEQGMFRGFDLGLEAARIGGSMPTVFNASNEIAVSKFLHREISFACIPDMIEKAMQAHKLKKQPSLDEILEIEKELRSELK